MHGQTTLRDIRNPVLSVWIRPQATMRYLQEHGTWATALLLATLDGIYVAIAVLTPDTPMAERLHWFSVVTIGVVAAPLAGIVGLFVSALFVKVSGKLLGGKASFRKLCFAAAWAGVPWAVASLLYVVSLMLFRQDLLRFMSGGVPKGGAGVNIALLAVIGLLVVLTIWALVLAVRTLGVVQNFGWFRSAMNILLAYAIPMAIALGIRFFLWQPFYVPSHSMEPTLLIGDHFFGNRLAYGYGRYSFPVQWPEEGRLWGGRPARGDIVVFRVRGDTDFVKRVVGLPGDEIQMKGGVLNINGLPVKMVYLREDTLEEISNGEKTARVFKETLPNGVSYEIYDTVQNGSVDDTQPFHVPSGHYFVMGDHRDNSSDSRFPEVGHVPYENLIAKVGVIYFSVRALKRKDIAHAFENVAWKRMFHRP